jgi:hypothetical protein
MNMTDENPSRKKKEKKLVKDGCWTVAEGR